jgi:outer membrane biosynthesis protein TonB
MDSPSSGFRRAAAASWALAGIGVVSVGGVSVLAYNDTVKPAAADVSTDVVEQAPAQVVPPPAEPPAPPPVDVVTTTAEPPPPPPPPVTTEQQAPVETYTPVPRYTPQQTVEQAPATQPAPTKAPTAPTTQRRQLTPTTVMAPNFSPHVSRSRGS